MWFEHFLLQWQFKYQLGDVRDIKLLCTEVLKRPQGILCRLCFLFVGPFPLVITSMVNESGANLTFQCHQTATDDLGVYLLFRKCAFRCVVLYFTSEVSVVAFCL